jgi:hypothetical protein
MSYLIRNSITNEPVEQHTTAFHAFRACCILNAVELMNRRTWLYAVDPAIEPVPFEELQLPNDILLTLLALIEDE